MRTDTDPMLSDQSFKPRKVKSRGVSSRFLSPTSASSHDNRVSSPTLTPSQASSPVRHKPIDTRKQRSLEDTTSVGRLWPSSIASSSPSHSSSNDKNVGTLADHLGNERLRDLLERKKDEKSLKNSQAFALSRQRSCSGYGRFENEKEKEKDIMKENHRQLGGSMRYLGKLHFSGKSSSSSNTSCDNSGFVPGRLSIDENVLFRNSKPTCLSRRKSDVFMDDVDGESERSENCSASDCSFSATGINSRKSGIEVSSKYLQDIPVKTKRMTTNSNIQHPVSLDASPKMKKFTIKNAIKRANSLTNYGNGSAKSQWALSPGRSDSPPLLSFESRERLMSFSSLKPPSSPSRSSPKGVEKLLNLGLDLFKAKKFSSTSSLAVSSESIENIHQLRLLHNRQMQWQYANARAYVANGNITMQVENKLLSAWDNLANLQRSVLLRKLQLQKEKLEMKLDRVIHSQMKQLEAWGDMERQHLSAISKTNECLHSVVCRVPLTQGVQVEPQLTCIALRHASDLGASIKSAVITYSPTAERTAALLSQLAEVVSQEKLLLEQCLELLQEISTLEIEERSLKCYMIQLNPWQQQIST